LPLFAMIMAAILAFSMQLLGPSGNAGEMIKGA
jgi:hypothetical protein